MVKRPPKKRTPKKTLAASWPLLQQARVGLKAALSEAWRRVPPSQRQQLGKWAPRAGLAAAAIIIMTGIGIYRLGWQNGWTKAVARVVPYPAAFVGLRPVYYSDYFLQVRSIKGYAAATETTAGSPKEINQQAIGQLVNHAFFARYAAARGIKLKRSEVEREVQTIFSAQGGEKAALKILKEKYGSTKSDFSRLVAAQLLRLKAEEALTRDPHLKQQAKDRLRGLLDELKQSDFASVARAHSQHSSALLEGDQQLVASGSLPQSVAQAAARLKDGEISGVIELDQGYMAVKRERASAGDVLVRVLEIRVNSAQWLADQHSKHSIIKLLRQAR